MRVTSVQDPGRARRTSRYTSRAVRASTTDLEKGSERWLSRHAAPSVASPAVMLQPGAQSAFPVSEYSRPNAVAGTSAGEIVAMGGPATAQQRTRPSLFAASPSGDSHQPLPESRRCEVNKRSQLQCEYRLARVDDVHGNGLRLKASQRDHELSCPDGPGNLVGKNARQSNPGDRGVDGGLCSVDDETRLYSHVSRGSIHSKYPRLGP